MAKAKKHIPGRSDYLRDCHVTKSEPMRSHEPFIEVSERWKYFPVPLILAYESIKFGAASVILLSRKEATWKNQQREKVMPRYS